MTEPSTIMLAEEWRVVAKKLPPEVCAFIRRKHGNAAENEIVLPERLQDCIDAAKKYLAAQEEPVKGINEHTAYADDLAVKTAESIKARPYPAVALLNKTAKVIGQGKRDVHGQPERSFRTIADFWNAYMEGLRRVQNTDAVVLSARNVAEMMEMFKLARAMHGDPSFEDHYIDRLGYCALAGEMATLEDR